MHAGLGFGGAVLALPLMLFPVAAIGHLLGMTTHDYLLEKDRLFKAVVGGAMAVIVAMGFTRVF